MIARETGLSISSVSRALKNSHEISEAKKIQVRRAAAALDYRKHLRRPTPNFLTISIYTGEIDRRAQGSIYAEIYRGIKEEAQRHGVRLIELKRETLFAQLTNSEQQFEGLILMGFDREDYLEALAATGKPIVLVNSQDPYGRIDSVLPDNLGCGAMVARHLQERQLSATLHLVHRARLTIEKRLEGYFARRKAISVPATPANDVIVDPGSFEERDLDTIRKEMARALNALDLRQFDSIVCWGILMKRALLDLAIAELAALPVVSVDSSEEAPHPGQELATVALPGRAIGSQAFQQLALRQFYRDAPGVRLLLSGRLQNA